MTAANLTPLEEVDYLEGVRNRRKETYNEIKQLERAIDAKMEVLRKCDEELCARLPGPDLRRADR